MCADWQRGRHPLEQGEETPEHRDREEDEETEANDHLVHDRTATVPRPELRSDAETGRTG
jgi:hypothetical protein